MITEAYAIQQAQRIVQAYTEANGGITPYPIGVLSPMPPQGDCDAPSYGILRTIEDQTGYTTTVSRVAALGDPFHAYILIYENPNRARIAYASDMNLCWSRFIVSKEASHLLLLNDDNKTQTADAAIRLINHLLNDSPISSTPETVAESAAYYAAIELIFPKQFMEIVRDFREHQVDISKIAESFRVPEKVVEFRLSADINNYFEEAYRGM